MENGRRNEHRNAEPGAAANPAVAHLRSGGFRFYFFSREELRMHVHVHHSNGEAEFWIEPKIRLARNHGLTDRQRAPPNSGTRR